MMNLIMINIKMNKIDKIFKVIGMKNLLVLKKKFKRKKYE